jgi:hypothetical protein
MRLTTQRLLSILAPFFTVLVACGDGSSAQLDGPVSADAAKPTFTISVNVTGLGGTGLVLTNNGGNDLAIGGNGAATFTTALQAGQSYSVAVKSQPTGPKQTCAVSGGTGTVVAGPISSIIVNCATDMFMIGGTVNGLRGTGFILQNNAGDDLVINSTGQFAFATTIVDGGAYAVAVLANPTTRGKPAQSPAGQARLHRLM